MVAMSRVRSRRRPASFHVTYLHVICLRVGRSLFSYRSEVNAELNLPRDFLVT